MNSSADKHHARALTTDALSYLALLRTLGHLAPQEQDRLLAQLPSGSGQVSRAEVRELLAIQLFCAHDALSTGQRELLEGEWALLFG